MEKLEDDLRTCYLRVRESLGRAAIRQKRYYDRKHHLNVYRRGDLVLVKTMVRKPGIGKLSDRYEGPYVVLAKLSDVTYRIQQSPRKKPKVIHHDRLKPFYPRDPAENDTEWVNIDQNARSQGDPTIIVPDTGRIVDPEATQLDQNRSATPIPLMEAADVFTDDRQMVPNTDFDKTIEYPPRDSDTVMSPAPVVTSPNSPNSSLQEDGAGFEPVTDENAADEDSMEVANDLDASSDEPPDDLPPPPKRQRRAPKRFGDWVAK